MKDPESIVNQLESELSTQVEFEEVGLDGGEMPVMPDGLQEHMTQLLSGHVPFGSEDEHLAIVDRHVQELDAQLMDPGLKRISRTSARGSVLSALLSRKSHTLLV